MIEYSEKERRKIMYDLELKEIIKALGIVTEERVIDNIVYYGWNDLNMRVDKFLSCLE